MRSRLFKTPQIDHALSIFFLASSYFNQKDDLKAEPLFLKSTEMFAQIVVNFFPSLSEHEKEKFWKRFIGNYEIFNSFAINRMKQNPAILFNMYDNQLFSKALLYTSSNKIKKRIQNSNDSSLIENYYNFLSFRDRLVKAYTMSDEELSSHNINIDSLENLANELEKKINLKSEDYKQSYEKKKVSWKSIQRLLKPDEATQLLMTSFYSNWITGMSKREAFIKAQLSTKQKYPDPYYWGAFVMVGE